MPAELDRTAVEQGLLGTRFENRLHPFASVDSTNQLALHAAQAGAQWGVWTADEQTAGRGRGDHTWHSAPGEGIYVSALVTPWIPMSYARMLPMAAGLAVKAAVAECTALQLDLRWPNDLMFGDRKCGGILVESASEPTSPHFDASHGPALRYAVIGIGLNVRHQGFPPELRAVATSLFLESGREFEREPLLVALLRHLDDEVKQMQRDFPGMHSGPDLYRRFSAASSWVSGKRVRVEEAGGYTGWTCGLDRQGFLQVRDDDGQLRTVLSGGVRSF